MQKNTGKKKKTGLALGLIAVAAVAGVGGWYVFLRPTPQEVIREYMGYIEEGDYEAMYQMLDSESQESVDEESFIERNQNIYEGIEASNLKIEFPGQATKDGWTKYTTTMDTVAGELTFDNQIHVHSEGIGMKIQWEDNVIFPELRATDKVQVITDESDRGSIYDRNGRTLAAQGVVSSVGLVPGQMSVDAGQQEEDIQKLADLLEISADSIQNALDASWVQDDSFVPVKEIAKDNSVTITLEGENANSELVDQLLEIPGVMVTDAEDRVYPTGEASAHLVGYVQSVTAEDLEKLDGQGYDANSVIGRSGLESLYETELKGEDGNQINILNEDGEVRLTLASDQAQDGEDIETTIDLNLQEMLYEQFKEDKSCSVAMNPLTGEVLALVSTPSYDNNEFVLGMSQDTWDALNEDEDQPLYNRFRQTFAPGSSFKPVTAGIGLSTGLLSADENLGYSGTSWQKDESWGSYYVTTLHDYGEDVTLRNAFVYSDNIYFAKAALQIGGETFTEYLKKIGFGQEVPFPISLTVSQYSNDGEVISDEIQLADSGYGQGQILVNPLHLVSIYTSFLNDGDMLEPKLLMEDSSEPSVWISEAFTQEAVQTITEDLVDVVNDSNGTGYGLHMDDIQLAGKTGTAEIKDSVDDTDGTELGWIAVYTTDPDTENPILIVTMVEDVKDRGGSGYVVDNLRPVLESYLTGTAYVNDNVQEENYEND